MEGGIYNSSSTNEIQDVQDNFGKQSLSFIGESLSIVTMPCKDHHLLTAKLHLCFRTPFQYSILILSLISVPYFHP